MYILAFLNTGMAQALHVLYNDFRIVLKLVF